MNQSITVGRVVDLSIRDNTVIVTVETEAEVWDKETASVARRPVEVDYEFWGKGKEKVSAVKKGDLISIAGEVVTRQWKDKRFTSCKGKFVTVLNHLLSGSLPGCTFHRNSANNNKPAPEPDLECPECKHVAAMSSKRESEGLPF